MSLSISHLLRVILLLIPSCRSPCDELDEVVGEDARPAVDLSLPPSLVLDVLGDDVDELALGETQLVVVDRLVGVHHHALLLH